MPDLPLELVFIWEVFATLSRARRRSLQFGKEGRQHITPDEIQVSEIIVLLNALGVVGVDSVFRVIKFIQRMDDAYLEKVRAGVK